MQSIDGSFSNAARNLGQLRRSPACWMWFGIVMVIQSAVAIAGGPEHVNAWFENFGLSRTGFLTGKVWQVFSYSLLHGGWWHAGLNAMFLLLIGSRIEHMAGSRVLTRAILAGVLGGALGHLLLGSGLLAGMSGGCLALLLLLTTISPQSRMFPLPVSGKSLGLGILLAELMLALIDPALGLPGFSLGGRALSEHGMAGWFQMGHACHFGGGLAGWLFGRWLLRSRVTLDRLRRARARREAN